MGACSRSPPRKAPELAPAHVAGFPPSSNATIRCPCGQSRNPLQDPRQVADKVRVNPDRDEDSASSLIAREKRQRRRLAALLDVSRLVASSLDPQAIFETVADKMNDLVGATEVTIFVIDDATQTMK